MYRTTFVACRGSLNQLALPLSWVIVLAGVQQNGVFVLFFLAVGKLHLALPGVCVSLSQYVSCPELLDQHYSVDVTVAEHSVQHPITKSSARRIVHMGSEQNSHRDPTAQHHCISLCRELEPYSAVIAAISDSKTSNIRQRPITFENATHYYLYNRLMDFLTSREIVNRQIQEIVQSCQPGEVVIRDALYRLGVAQIKTETEEDEEGKQEDYRGC